MYWISKRTARHVVVSPSYCKSATMHANDKKKAELQICMCCRLWTAGKVQKAAESERRHRTIAWINHIFISNAFDYFSFAQKSSQNRWVANGEIASKKTQFDCLVWLRKKNPIQHKHFRWFNGFEGIESSIETGHLKIEKSHIQIDRQVISYLIFKSQYNVFETLRECLAVDVYRWNVSHLLISTIVRIAIKSSTHAERYMCETVSFEIIKQSIYKTNKFTARAKYALCSYTFSVESVYS